MKLAYTLLMLVFVSRFPLTSRVIFSEEFFIHFSCWLSLVRSFSYILHALLIVRSFSYTPDATFSEEFLLHS